MVLNPRLIPGFEIERRLASGGVAEVFRARRDQDRVLMALKVMSLANFDPDFHAADRFEREAALLSRLNHPALPRFYDHGVTADAFGWIALELVQGRPLGTLSSRTVPELLPVFIQIAEGLQAVAQEGIVHRDISPDNILVEERHGRLVARLIDFGVAKDLLAGEGAGELTQHGAFVGKLAYASPEQLLGLPKGEHLDFRSDVYSLGLTFYEVLTGRRAVTGESFPEVVDAHTKGGFPPVAIPVERGGPAPRLAALVTRMTARRREDRPASWEEILAELWRCREEASPLAETLARKRGESTSTGETRATPRPPRKGLDPLSKERLVGRLVLGAGVVAFLLALGFAISVVRRHPPSGATPGDPPGPAVEPAASPAPRAATAPAHAARTPRPTVAPTARPTREGEARPSPVRAPVAATGFLEISLSPAGELEAVLDESGRSVVARRRLPTRVELPAGRYTVKLFAPGLDCTRTVAATVRAGKSTAVTESCIEIK